MTEHPFTVSSPSELNEGLNVATLLNNKKNIIEISESALDMGQY
jgi:hypothetical protein